MGVKVTVGGRRLEVASYSVTEASTPISLADSSGEVGSISFDAPAGDKAAPWFVPKGEKLTLKDDRRGSLVGATRLPSINEAERMMSTQGVSRLADLNIYNVVAKPYVGTLGGAFTYYLGLAGVKTGYRVEGGVETKPVRFIGWEGELWANLKSMCAGHGVEIALVSDVIVLRPIRQREAIRGRDTDRSLSPANTSLAQKVEVWHYQTRAITDALVYPPHGWNEDVEIISVNAGERVEQTLELEASVSSISRPVCLESIGPGDVTRSAYTVVGNDGLPVTPAAWEQNGGWLRAEIGKDSMTIELTVQAPTGLPSKDGAELTSFSIAMASGESNNYSSLRIVGNGIAFSKKLYSFPTGVDEKRASQEVGITIDNQFMTDLDDVFSAGALLAREYSARALSLSGTVTAVNQLSNGNIWRTRTYDELMGDYAGLSYDQVKQIADNLGISYAALMERNRELIRDDFQNQVFGNTGGARVWDAMSRNWFRIRSATIGPDVVSFDADQDTTYGDVVRRARAQGITYADMKARDVGRTYAEVAIQGVPE